MNRDNDMAHVKGAEVLRAEMAEGRDLSGVYGDAQGARGFSDAESEMLRAWSTSEWRVVPAGPGTTHWTIIRKEAGLRRCFALGRP